MIIDYVQISFHLFVDPIWTFSIPRGLISFGSIHLAPNTLRCHICRRAIPFHLYTNTSFVFPCPLLSCICAKPSGEIRSLVFAQYLSSYLCALLTYICMHGAILFLRHVDSIDPYCCRFYCGNARNGIGKRGFHSDTQTVSGWKCQTNELWHYLKFSWDVLHFFSLHFALVREESSS